MTLGKLFRDAAHRIAEGETDTKRLTDEYVALVLADDHLTRQAVWQLVRKRIVDAASAHLKPSGVTARVPAGQMSWLAMDPTIAIARMTEYIKRAARISARADIDAKVLGYIHASGLEPGDFSTFGDLCAAAAVPQEFLESLAA